MSGGEEEEEEEKEEGKEEGDEWRGRGGEEGRGEEHAFKEDNASSCT